MAASQLPRRRPYSVSASTAYWLHVGLKRHVGSRNGDTVWRYNSMAKTKARTAADRRARTD
jgi:hypothetical protein